VREAGTRATRRRWRSPAGWRSVSAVLSVHGLSATLTLAGLVALLLGSTAMAAAHRSHAPAGPPLVSHVAASNPPAETPKEEPESFVQPAVEGDPLVSNGLGSPLCGHPAGAGGLSGQALRNCRTSGFLAAPAPTSNYAFDVNMEHGALNIDPMALLQDYILEPVWIALVWVVHALLVMLEWCYSIDLLDSSTMGEVGRGLRQAQATFTDPWLVSVLAVASVLTLYHGLVRRQVAQSLGQALVTIAMMAAGLWMIADPAGTVGALGQWTNQASLGTLGAVAQGAPGGGARPFSEGVATVFAYGIEAPWCYLEFGNVRWCRDPAQLEGRLRMAALHSASLPKNARLHCSEAERNLEVCTPMTAEEARAGGGPGRERLLDAQTNGALFLALPANGALRNSVSASGSLLNVLCGSREINNCSGPTAAQAQFRSAGATGQRAAGLLLILAGALGMVLVLGFVALHLLGAALLSLLYLLMAPAAVLAPALGDGGRAVFRGWATRLLGAVVSKLLFSLLLGTLLLMVRILLSLQGLGWWTQWLLVSVVWWGAWRQRHQVLSFAGGEHRPAAAAGSLTARVQRALAGPRMAMRGAGMVKGRFSRPAPTVAQQTARTQAVRERARAQADAQAGRTLEHEHGLARAQVRAAPRAQADLGSKQSQLARVRGAQRTAREAGDTRRAAQLDARAQRIEGEIADRQQSLFDARQAVGEGERAQRTGGRVYTRTGLQERARFLDSQAALPGSIEAARAGARAAGAAAGTGMAGTGSGGTALAGSGTGADRGMARAGEGLGGALGRGGAAGELSRATLAQRRDYAALASLAGYGRAEYQQLDPLRQRQARLEIDRELALRRELGGAAAELARGGGSLGGREQRKVAKEFDRTVGQRMKDGGHEPPASSRSPSSPVDGWLAESERARSLASGNSPVMRDIHEVAQRRKRQLGRPARR
jgi:hypothetical protein